MKSNLLDEKSRTATQTNPHSLSAGLRVVVFGLREPSELVVMSAGECKLLASVGRSTRDSPDFTSCTLIPTYKVWAGLPGPNLLVNLMEGIYNATTELKKSLKGGLLSLAGMAGQPSL